MAVWVGLTIAGWTATLLVTGLCMTLGTIVERSATAHSWFRFAGPPGERRLFHGELVPGHPRDGRFVLRSVQEAGWEQENDVVRLEAPPLAFAATGSSAFLLLRDDVGAVEASPGVTIAELRADNGWRQVPIAHLPPPRGRLSAQAAETSGGRTLALSEEINDVARGTILLRESRGTWLPEPFPVDGPLRSAGVSGNIIVSGEATRFSVHSLEPEGWSSVPLDVDRPPIAIAALEADALLVFQEGKGSARLERLIDGRTAVVALASVGNPKVTSIGSSVVLVWADLEERVWAARLDESLRETWRGEVYKKDHVSALRSWEGPVVGEVSSDRAGRLLVTLSDRIEGVQHLYLARVDGDEVSTLRLDHPPPVLVAASTAAFHLDTFLRPASWSAGRYWWNPVGVVLGAALALLLVPVARRLHDGLAAGRFVAAGAAGWPVGALLETYLTTKEHTIGFPCLVPVVMTVLQACVLPTRPSRTRLGTVVRWTAAALAGTALGADVAQRARLISVGLGGIPVTDLHALLDEAQRVVAFGFIYGLATGVAALVTSSRGDRVASL